LLPITTNASHLTAKRASRNEELGSCLNAKTQTCGGGPGTSLSPNESVPYGAGD
jgi:hypothetical protein